MEKDKILYTTPDNQIEKLKTQGLIINNPDFARSELALYGYSNLIKSYRDPYIIVTNGSKSYRSGVTFEQVLSLYMLDKNLRNAVMAAMLDLEEYVKESAADVIASKYGTDQQDYLQYRNYVNKKKRKQRFALPAILDTMKKTLNTDKNPIAHYAQKYGTVPPWILFKSVYFSTIVNFINLFKREEQISLAAKLYDTSTLQLSDTELVSLMIDTLFICIEYRNLSAHGNRIYNHRCESKLRPIKGVNNLYGFSQLLFLLRLLKYQQPFKYLNEALNQQLSRHCSMYPEDITYLGQILNINIVQRTPVWISPRSNKYHIDEHCCGIKKASRLELSEAQEQGFLPCKKCCRENV